ncbi:unnamed protein product [Protopolystoma xenopodis]|uniref:Uncharacterized protein n=1 Tax=Protopolystoma xenopodis TaxID=117903 RepID=A0A448WX75_9PLAT|nr:unnamed protein product [Protopolystoma xenopodis]
MSNLFFLFASANHHIYQKVKRKENEEDFEEFRKQLRDSLLSATAKDSEDEEESEKEDVHQQEAENQSYSMNDDDDDADDYILPPGFTGPNKPKRNWQKIMNGLKLHPLGEVLAKVCSQ